ncbi:TVP38/TMEM64 family protein [Hymenobacter chitinivorans]|uniref:TVP38/TMEM64 family membrane protein n=1 Tax=Hymenobacter chitinivorans DSM 11115 TaxID=1121954 RepID=A0A2M9BSA7_9BACT|nr:TVP38/TMEM64 family protein [Hymenobacter chitinivorans]PJJ60817.1 putative membrane protein YdjX (TVP38/TMEM64 family) [Hymenobacter chitinivorans DSM 11115]
MVKSPSSAPSQKTSRLPLYLAGGLLLTLVACYFLWPAFQTTAQEAFAVLKSGEQARVSAWIRQFGYWGPVVIVAAMVVQMFLVVVNVVLLILVAILAYGPWWGSLLALVGCVVASSVGYWLGRSAGEAFIGRLIGEKSEKKMVEEVQRYGTWAVVIARLSPALSDDAVSFVAGVARLGYGRFLLATVAGVLPLIALLAWLGENSERLKTGLLWVSIVSVVLFIGYVWWDKRRTKSAPPEAALAEKN